MVQGSARGGTEGIAANSEEKRRFSIGALAYLDESECWDEQRTCVDPTTGALVSCDPREPGDVEQVTEIGETEKDEEKEAGKEEAVENKEKEEAVEEEEEEARQEQPEEEEEKEKEGGNIERGEEKEKTPWYAHQLVPWYDQFLGTIEPDAAREGTFIINGVFERLPDGEHIRVTELPVGEWKDIWITAMRDRCRYYPAGAEMPSSSAAAAKKQKRKKDDEAEDDNADGDASGAEEEDDEDKDDKKPKKKTTKKNAAPKESTHLRKAVGFYISDEDNSTKLRVDVTIRCDREQLAEMSDEDIVKALKLRTTLSTRNMMLYNRAGRLKRYRHSDDIFGDFVVARHYAYELRKDYQLAQLRFDSRVIFNRKRFIGMVIEGQLILTKKRDDVLIAELERLRFERIEDKFVWVHPDAPQHDRMLAKTGRDDGKEAGGEEDDEEEEDTTLQNAAKKRKVEAFSSSVKDGVNHDEDDNGNAGDAGDSGEQDEKKDSKYGGFGYLLRMPLSSLTERRWRQLCAEEEQAHQKIVTLRSTSVEQMWMRDLDEFEQQYEAFLDRKALCLAKNAEQDGLTKKQKKPSKPKKPAVPLEKKRKNPEKE